MCLLPELMGNWYTRPTFKKQSSDCLADDITREPSGSGVSSTGNDTSSEMIQHKGLQEVELVVQMIHIQQDKRFVIVMALRKEI